MPATLGGVFRVEAEMEERVMVLACYHRDIAAASAIAAARPSARHVFLAPEREATVSAIAGLDADFDFIDKHGGGGRWRDAFRPNQKPEN
jgi:hypothetical protein